MNDGFKGGVHLLAFGLSATMGFYNFMEALSERRTRRHMVNASIYLVACVFEAYNVRSHWSHDAGAAAPRLRAV